MTTEYKHPPDPFYVLRGAGSPCTSLVFPSEMKYWLISGCQDGIVHIWDQVTKRSKFKMDAHPGSCVLWVEMLDDGRLITHGRDGFVKIWRERDGEMIAEGTFTSSTLSFCAPCLIRRAHAAALVAPSDVTAQLDVFDLESRKLINSISPESSQKYGMCMSVRQINQNEIIVGYENGSLVIWDIRSGKMVTEIKMHQESIMCMDFSLSSNKGISASSDENICCWTVDDARMITETHRVCATSSGFSAVKFRSDDKLVAAAGWDGTVRIFGAKKMKQLAVLSYHKKNVRSLAFSSDNILACGSDDSLISLWDIYK